MTEKLGFGVEDKKFRAPPSTLLQNDKKSCLMNEKIGFEVKIFRAPPWARLLQEEWEVETRRRLNILRL